MDIEHQVEGYQVHHNGRTSTITVWVAKDINLEKFCRVEGINVTKGVMTGMIRPSGRSDVTVSVNGLDFNTPDSLMFDYIKRFGGKIISNSVIYCKYLEGPFRGKYSGERKYQVDFPQNSRRMGTYHYLDGARIRIFYRGNEKTCGRCHGPARVCPGKGMAKDCDAAGGPRVNLNDHMKKLWREIGFQPVNFTLPSGDDISDQNDIPIVDKTRFQRADKPPAVTEEIEERFVGMSIANMNLDLTDANVKKFVADYVSDKIDEKDIDIVRDQRKITVTISANLNAKIIKEAMSRINFRECREKFSDRPLYCRPLRDITPEKVKDPAPSSSSNSAQAPSTTNGSPNSTGGIPKIPGFSPDSQEKTNIKKAKKERQKLRKAEELETKEKEEKKLKNLSIFDKMMKSRHMQDKLKDPLDVLIPAHCSPHPWTSTFGRQLSEQSRRMSVGSSPNLKRGAELLSSPNSPQHTNIPKKNKDSVVVDGSPSP